MKSSCLIGRRAHKDKWKRVKDGISSIRQLEGEKIVSVHLDFERVLVVNCWFLEFTTRPGEAEGAQKRAKKLNFYLFFYQVRWRD